MIQPVDIDALERNMQARLASAGSTCTIPKEKPAVTKIDKTVLIVGAIVIIVSLMIAWRDGYQRGTASLLRPGYDAAGVAKIIEANP